jgi:hypothetical protein
MAKPKRPSYTIQPSKTQDGAFDILNKGNGRVVEVVAAGKGEAQRLVRAYNSGKITPPDVALAKLRGEAYNAIERDSYSEDPDIQARADKAMDAYLGCTITEAELQDWAYREREYRMLNEPLGDEATNTFKRG